MMVTGMKENKGNFSHFEIELGFHGRFAAQSHFFPNEFPYPPGFDCNQSECDQTAGKIDAVNTQCKLRTLNSTVSYVSSEPEQDFEFGLYYDRRGLCCGRYRRGIYYSVWNQTELVQKGSEM